MPVALSYPGVYIEEIPSGVRTITGVATSITAFAGWGPKGPTDSAGLVLSWADFVRRYGGLNANSNLGYAVSHFFLNGGQQAYIIRLAYTGAASATLTPAATASLTLAPLAISAQNPGVWANDYAVAIKGQATGNRFQLQVVFIDPADSTGNTQVVVESFANLSATNPDPLGRFVGDVVNNQSSYITVNVTQPPTPAKPANTPVPLTATQKLSGGVDGTALQPNTAEFEAALIPGGVIGGTGGINLLDHVDLFNILCVPGEITTTIVAMLEKYCHDHRAFLIDDSDPNATLTTVQTELNGITGSDAINAAFYFPWV